MTVKENPLQIMKRDFGGFFPPLVKKLVPLFFIIKVKGNYLFLSAKEKFIYELVFHKHLKYNLNKS